MDVTVQWVVSENVEGLVSALCDAKLKLMGLAKEMWDDEVSEFSTVYAHKKIVELLRLSDGWKDATDQSEQLSYENRRLAQFTASHLVATFKEFSLHEDEIIAHDVVRLIVQVDVKKKLYANVRLVAK